MIPAPKVPGTPGRPPKPKRLRAPFVQPPSVTHEMLLEAAATGGSATELAIRWRVSTQTVWKFAKRFGVSLNQAGPGQQAAIDPSDLIGRRFGLLKVVEVDTSKKGPGHRYLCRCHCGTIVTAARSKLVGSLITKCVRCSIAGVRVQGKPDREASVQRTFTSYRSSATSRAIPFELSFADVEALVFLDCHYCGAPPEMRLAPGRSRRPLPTSGIDRIDNAAGYVRGNVVPCCRACNISKLDRSYDDYVAWIERVYRHQRRLRGLSVPNPVMAHPAPGNKAHRS